MSLAERLGKDARASYNSIYRLGHCAEYRPVQDQWLYDRPPYQGDFFDIGNWETMEPVETRKKKRSHVTKEQIDNENIDYDSHLTPKIENMKYPLPCVRPIRKQVSVPVMDLGEKTECFCYVCLIRLNIDKEVPEKMITMANRHGLPKLIKVSLSTEDLVLKMLRAMTIHHIARPIGLSYSKFSYKQLLDFFEVQCRPELMDVGVVLNDYMLEIANDPDTKKMRKLSEVYKALVYASSAKILYKFLSIHLTAEKLLCKTLLSVKGRKEFDPMGLSEPELHESTNLETNVFRLFQ